MKNSIENNYLAFYQGICSRLKTARVCAGYASAKEFALKNTLKISTYALHESGVRSMSLKVLMQYASLLNVKMKWLLTGTQ